MAGLAVSDRGLEVSQAGTPSGAPLVSPHFSGTPTAPTATQTSTGTQLATLAFANGVPTGVSVVTNPQWGAKCDGKTVADGAITSATATLTSNTANWTAADQGKRIKVAGAGATISGHPGDLNTTIQTVNSSTSVTLAANASATVSGANVYWGTDDTTAVQNALNAGGYVRVPANTTIVLTHLAPVAGAILDLTGVTVYHIPTLNNGLLKYTNVGSNDQPTIDKFQLIGGYYVYTGNENFQQMPVNVYDVNDFTIRDAIVSGCASPGWFTSNCQTVRVLYCTFVTSTYHAGTNVINFVQLTSGGQTTTPSNLWAIGNYINIPGNVACISVTGSASSQGANTVPVNAIFVGNNLQCNAFSCIAFESGGTSTTFYVQFGIIALNLCKQTATSGSAFGIVSEDDSTGTPSSDPNIHAYILIALNVVNTGRHGIGVNGSSTIVLGNVIDMVDQTSTGNGIYIAGNAVTQGTNNLVEANLVIMPAASGAANGMYLWHQTNSTAMNNRIVWPTGSTGTGNGIYVQASTNVRVHGGDVLNAPAFAVQFDTITDCMADGLYIYNPCTAGVQVSAITAVNTLTGALVVRNCHFYDNRGGSAKMTHAINNSASGGTAYTGLNTSIGHTGTATGGTWTSLTAF